MPATSEEPCALPRQHDGVKAPFQNSQQWKIEREVFPGATRAVYEHEQQFLPAITMYDMQLEHATRCTIPSPQFPGEEAWYINFGDAEGTTEEVFLLKSIIASGR